MRRYEKIWLTLAMWIFAMCALAAPASAQRGLVGQPIAVCIAAVRAGDTPAAMLEATDRFDCISRQTDFGPGDYWVRSEPLRISGPMNLRMASLWQRESTMWTAYADDHISARHFDGRALARTIQLGAIVEIPLVPRDAAVSRLLWRVDGSPNLRGIMLATKLATPEESVRSNIRLAALYGAFGGLCIALLVYHLALWAAQRHHFQLAYCAMLVMLGLYALSSSGALAWLVPDLPNNVRLQLNYLTLAGSALAAVIFVRTFFESHVFHGWLSQLLAIITTVVVTSSLFIATAAEWNFALFDRVYASSLLLLILATGPLLWQAWRRQSAYVWLFAYAWALPVILAGARAAGNLNLVPWSFLLDNSTLVAMAVEAMLSSLAIAYRTRLLARERDEARRKEIIARELADLDPLTGLLNRRAFMREAIGRPDMQQLIIADIDHFKTVNDTLGHDGGDEVLRMVAHVIRDIAPETALVARLGGEEFAILVPGSSQFEVDHLLANVRAQRMPFDLRVTTSLGTATGSIATEGDWKQLYRDADQALFAAKAAGRDRARATPMARAA